MNTYCPNWEAIDETDALPHYWHETKRRLERRRIVCQVAAALLACVTMFAAGVYAGAQRIGFTRSQYGVESESWSADDSLYLRLGDNVYCFAPNVARAIGEDLVVSAEELEDGK